MMFPFLLYLQNVPYPEDIDVDDHLFSGILYQIK